jgi:hypothetical protein
VVGTQFPANQNPAAPVVKALIAHWNGRRWDRVPTPAVPGYGQVSLFGIAAAATDDIWAVGYAEKASALVTRTVTEHWNGRRWRLVPSPSHGNTFALGSVAAARDGQAWAVGENYFGVNARPFVLHWNGRGWQRADTPLTANVGLSGVAAAGTGAVWAVGSVFSGLTGHLRPYALHWNGHHWAGQAWPSTAGNDDRQLTAITALRAGDFAAIGEDSGTAGALDYGELYARWIGHRWSLLPGGDDGVSLNAVTGIGSRCLWSVGAEGGSGNTFRPHVEVNARNC